MTGYSLEGKVNDGAYEVINSDPIPATVNSLRLLFKTTPPEKVQFFFRLRSIRGDGYSNYSNEATCVIPMNAPSNISTTFDARHAAISVEWAQNSAVATQCRIERIDVDETGHTRGEWTEIARIASSNAYLDHSIQELKNYIYRVSNLMGDEATWPATADDYVHASVFAAGGLQIQATSKGLSLSWTNVSKYVTQPIVLRKDGDDNYGSFIQVATLSPNATSYEDVGLPLGYYSYEIQTNYGVESSVGDRVVGVLQSGATSLPIAPKSLQISPANDAVLRPQGTWIFSNDYPWGIQSNGDPWMAIFPKESFPSPNLFLMDDLQGWPHWVNCITSDNTTNSSLKHHWFDGAQWQDETFSIPLIVPPIPVAWTFRLDRSNGLHGLVGMAPSLDLAPMAQERYIHKVGDAWTSESISSPSNLGKQVISSTLSVDRDGVPHVLLGLDQGLPVECIRAQDGTWSNVEIPGISYDFGVSYDAHFGSWIDDENAVLVFHQYSLLFSTPYPSQMLLVRKVSGVWQLPIVMFKMNDTYIGNWKDVAISPDLSRVAVCWASPLGIKLHVWSKDGISESLVAPEGNYSLHRVGFDASNAIHILLETYGDNSFVDYVEAH